MSRANKSHMDLERNLKYTKELCLIRGEKNKKLFPVTMLILLPTSTGTRDIPSHLLTWFSGLRLINLINIVNHLDRWSSKSENCFSTNIGDREIAQSNNIHPDEHICISGNLWNFRDPDSINTDFVRQYKTDKICICTLFRASNPV